MAKVPRISDFIVSMLPPSLSALFEGFDGSQSAYSALARKLEPALTELPEVLVAFQTAGVEVDCLLPNTTDILQVMDLVVNGPGKAFLRRARIRCVSG